MGKKPVFAAVVVAAVLLAITVLLIFPSENRARPAAAPEVTAPATEPASECEGLGEFEREVCMRDLAVKNKDFGYCEGFASSCKMSVIAEIGDYRLCGEIFESKYQRSPCYEAMAIMLENSSICKLIEDDEVYRQQCLTQVAGITSNLYSISLTEDVRNPPSIARVTGTIADYEYYPGPGTKVYLSFKSLLDGYYGVFELDDNLNYLDLRLEIPELSNSTHTVFFQKNRITEGDVLTISGDESDWRLTGAITLSPDLLIIQSRADECKEFMNAPAYCYATKETDIGVKVWMNFRIEN